MTLHVYLYFINNSMCVNINLCSPVGTLLLVLTEHTSYMKQEDMKCRVCIWCVLKIKRDKDFLFKLS